MPVAVLLSAATGTHQGEAPMTASHDTSSHSIEPDVLDDELTPDDIAFALSHLRFNRNGLATLRVDQGQGNVWLEIEDVVRPFGFAAPPRGFAASHPSPPAAGRA